MTDTLATFADQVTTVAREVGVEGKLGGPGQGAGCGRHLEGPDREREPARGEPHDAGARDRRGGDRGDTGDLTRSITVEAQGEVAALKDTINEMIRNLKDTTQKNTEQDWLKTNLAKFSRMLQGQKDLLTVVSSSCRSWRRWSARSRPSSMC